MKNKRENLVFIEKCFGHIKAKDDVNGNITRIERALSREFDLKFNLSIVKNTTNQFFGMNIFPSVSTMDIMVESIIDKKSSVEEILEVWQKNDTWYIEIDDILLYDTNLNANPAEITAVLLHEIGHTVYDSTIPRRLNKTLRYKLMKLTYQMRALVSNEKIRKLFNLAILESCTTKSYTFTNVKSERFADKFVLDYGYGNELDEFIGKLIKSQGNSLINKTDKELEKEVEIIVNWTVVNIKELEFRKKALRQSLKVEMMKSPSDLTKRVIQDIYVSFFGESTDKYRALLSEQYTGDSRDIYNEMKCEQILMNDVKRIIEEASLGFFDKLGKVKKVSQSDIDILSVDASNIENNDDKIYLLDRLYILLERVNAALDLIEIGKEKKVAQSKSTLLNMRDQLNKIREQILSTKVIDKEYGVFIKYPKGYQG